jgi:hypothetical protein
MMDEKNKLNFAYNGVVVQSCYSYFYHVMHRVKGCEFHRNVSEFHNLSVPF